VDTIKSKNPKPVDYTDAIFNWGLGAGTLPDAWPGDYYFWGALKYVLDSTGEWRYAG